MIGKMISIVVILLQLSNIFALNIISEVNKTSTSLQEPIEYTLVLESNENRQLPKFNMPNMPDWEIIGQSFSSSTRIINDSVQTTSRQKYQLLPLKLGELIIPKITFSFEGKNYQSNEHVISVKDTSNSNQIAQKTLPDIFLVSTSDKKEYYVNEPILYTISFYTNRNVYSLSNIAIPELNNLSVVNEIPQEQTQYQVHLNGKNYNVFEISFVLKSSNEGNANIGITRLGYSFSPFARMNYLTSPELDLKIKKLNNLASTTPIGDYSISAKLSTTNTVINNGLNLEVIIQGVGDLKITPPLGINFPRFIDHFEPKTEIIRKIQNNKVASTKTFSYLLIPRKPGRFVLPEIEFKFFSTNENKLKIIKTDKLSLNVKDVFSTNKSNINNNSYLNNTEKFEIHYLMDIPEKSTNLKNTIKYYLKILILFICGSFTLNLIFIVTYQKANKIRKLNKIKSQIYKFLNTKKLSEVEKINKIQSLLTKYIKIIITQDNNIMNNSIISSIVKTFDEIKYSPNREERNIKDLLDKFFKEISKLKLKRTK